MSASRVASGWPQSTVLKKYQSASSGTGYNHIGMMHLDKDSCSVSACVVHSSAGTSLAAKPD